jgi:lipid II:glycine glycyltransferase (peptidoglycan interpeptide bridge formation enzyme)
MELIDISDHQRKEYNALVTHPLQSFEWGEFRKSSGVTVVRKGINENGHLVDAFTMTVHPIPHTPFTIGYLPKGKLPNKRLIEILRDLGKEYKCVFIQVEPNVIKSSEFKVQSSNLGLRPSHHPLFTKYTFTLDLTKSEDELLAQMHPKTRYNVRLAARKGVTVQESNTPEAFNAYLDIMDETTTRQKFYAHSHQYHKIQWETLPHTAEKNTLSSHLLTATFEKDILVTWILFVFNDYLYYPYGASSSKYKELMASNLMMWEAIVFGKRHGLHTFDMWGALGPDADQTDPWYGFHRFKQNYGAVHTEFLGNFDLVLNPAVYKIYQGADFLRWGILKLKKRG